MMEHLKDIAIFFSLAVSVCSLFIVYTYRKKDFQIAILKEQMAAYSDLLENLFQTKEALNKLYQSKMSESVLNESDEDFVDKFELTQTLIFVEFGEEYDKSFNRFQKQIFLLPEDVIDATMAYYNYMADLFENNNDENLGVKLLTELNQKIFEVMNENFMQ